MLLRNADGSVPIVNLHSLSLINDLLTPLGYVVTSQLILHTQLSGVLRAHEVLRLYHIYVAYLVLNDVALGLLSSLQKRRISQRRDVAGLVHSS